MDQHDLIALLTVGMQKHFESLVIERECAEIHRRFDPRLKVLCVDHCTIGVGANCHVVRTAVTNPIGDLDVWPPALGLTI
jgi:hypothetical protein